MPASAKALQTMDETGKADFLALAGAWQASKRLTEPNLVWSGLVGLVTRDLLYTCGTVLASVVVLYR
jgi:hypothetical protein|eukprot:COSAG06_NODE_2588_length_6613_cov_2.940292_2_plen_67_part_00